MKKQTNIVFLLAIKLAWLLILFWCKTARITVVGRRHWRKAVESGAGVLIVIWHGRFLLPVYILRNKGVTAMVSQHTDGEMIAQTVQRLGFHTVRGSSTRGGKEAFHKMASILKQRHICVIIPDGPRGPRHKFKAGALYLAQRSGAYLLPLTFSSSRKIQLKSWDRFTLWWPFTKCIVMYGEPEQVPKNLKAAEMVQFRNTIQKRLIELEAKADAYFCND